MNLFENLTRLNEKNADEVINQFVEADISFEDNSTNNVPEKIGRFSLFDGLIEIFEPDEDIPGYKAIIVGELSDIDNVIEELKEDEITSEQIAVIRSLVEDRFETLDGEDVHELIINAFPLEEVSDEIPEEAEEVDEVIIEEESVKVEEDAGADYRATRRIDYIRDVLNFIYEKALPNSVYPLITKMYHLASSIEDEISKNNNKEEE